MALHPCSFAATSQPEMKSAASSMESSEITKQVIHFPVFSVTSELACTSPFSCWLSDRSLKGLQYGFYTMVPVSHMTALSKIVMGSSSFSQV